MQQTISQLSKANKQLEEEKSGLVMATRIIQNDSNQHGNSNKKGGEARKEIKRRKQEKALMRIRGEYPSRSIKARGQLHY